MQEENKVAEAVTAAPAAGAAVVSIDDFSKIDIKIGTILSAEPIEGSEKLLKLSVDFGESAPRQVLSGIAKFVTPEELVGKQCPFVANLPPRQMMGLESRAMILAARTAENGCVLLHPAKPLPPGADLG
ncbi:MAG TPA: hypothetical protein VJJ47_03260 [Candidatus Paceibacterota bacterium]